MAIHNHGPECQRLIRNLLVDVYNRSIRARKNLPDNLPALTAAHLILQIHNTLLDDLHNLLDELKEK